MLYLKLQFFLCWSGRNIPFSRDGQGKKYHIPKRSQGKKGGILRKVREFYNFEPVGTLNYAYLAVIEAPTILPNTLSKDIYSLADLTPK